MSPSLRKLEGQLTPPCHIPTHHACSLANRFGLRNQKTDEDLDEVTQKYGLEYGIFKSLKSGNKVKPQVLLTVPKCDAPMEPCLNSMLSVGVARQIRCCLPRNLDFTGHRVILALLCPGGEWH